MVKIIGSRREDEVSVSINAKNWDSAARALLHCYGHQPDGYQLITARISRRGARGGQRCQLLLVLRHSNLAHPAITEDEADDLFQAENTIAHDAHRAVQIQDPRPW